MKRILPVCVLALWSALNSQSTLALVQAAPSSVATNPPYVGEKMSLNFQNVEVRTVLQLLADFTGFNLVVSDAVQGSITLNLQDVPWDQALDLVLESKDLDKRLEGNVLLIAPSEHIAGRELQALELRNFEGQLLDHRLIAVDLLAHGLDRLAHRLDLLVECLDTLYQLRRQSAQLFRGQLV